MLLQMRTVHDPRSILLSTKPALLVKPSDPMKKTSTFYAPIDAMLANYISTLVLQDILYSINAIKYV